MTNQSVKSNFSSDEWMKVMTGAGNAGAAVVAASPSGVTGLVAEMSAIVKGVREEVSKNPRTPLMEAIAADLVAGPPEGLQQDEQGRITNMEEAVEKTLEGVRQALWLVDSKTSPEDAASYRDMLRTVAQRVAEAAKEGGFLGIGGEQINDKERDVLARLEELMGGQSAGAAANGETAASTDPLSNPSPDGSGNAN
ncbi:hypothetical protein [Deinococcus sp. Marseille-Q6407]|uniref:hypothetical protein n=1 Tax=Deinococcus sp. Marseille-Q6407 TaxID=2969223 RepID=UPI0021BE1320|nr:hypothetical protein [Deinococcus sp. Marseille-Q6407]